jgi:hypothetical protein
VAAAAGAVAAEVGIAVDLTAVGFRVTDTVGVPAPVGALLGEAAGLVAAGLGGAAVAVTMGDAWPSEGAAD